MTTIRDALINALDHYRTFDDTRPDLIPTGIALIDQDIGGLDPGDFGVLGARTGIGKSSLMLSLAVQGSEPTGIVTTEDGPDVIATRYAAAITKIDSRRIRRKELSEDEIQALKDLIQRDDFANLHIEHEISGKADAIAEATRRLAEGGARLIWLDYLQDVSTGQGDRRGEINNVLIRFKEALKDANAAGVVISQFHRLREDGWPTLHSFKESGDIENKARFALLMYEETEDGKPLGRPTGNLVLKLAKNSYGEAGGTETYYRDGSGTLRRHEPFAKTKVRGWI